MNSTVILVGSIVLLLIIAFFVMMIVSGNKAKKNYKPPVASEKTVLPDLPDAVFPVQSGKELHFCPKCGTGNSDRAKFCSNCGSRI